MEILQGAVSAVVYQNYDNGYSVLRLNVGVGQTVTVVGTIPLPAVGERLMVTGKWSSHSSYGRQFEAEFLERLMPQTTMEILSYLSSRVIKGIGPKMAERIVSHFGEETLLVMEREPLRLAEVVGISREKAKLIGEEFKLQVGMRQLMEFFAVHHMPAELAVRTYKIYGDATIELLYDDPYLLMDEGLDAPFGAVDRFAIELGDKTYLCKTQKSVCCGQFAVDTEAILWYLITVGGFWADSLRDLHGFERIFFLTERRSSLKYIQYFFVLCAFL